jgi:hypothetical protein
MNITEGTYWFRRLMRDCRKISPHIRIKRIKMGFYRIYWQDAYLHEVYKEMPQKGYDIEEEDPRLESKQYYEEYEDTVDTVRTIKNFVEGYYDSLDHIKTRVYLLKNDKEFEQTAKNAYKQVYIK